MPDFMSYRCLDTGIHLVMLQVMIGQMMRSSGKCIYCGQDVTASTTNPALGKYP